MGLTDKFSQIAGNVQEGVKNSSVSLFNIILKILTGFMIGLTFALIGQEMMTYGTFAFVFIMVVTTGAIFKFLSTWSVGQVLLFDLFCVLVALLLRMYIIVAP